MEILISVKKHLKLSKNSHRSTVGGGGQIGHFGSLGDHGPKFPLDPPAITSNISLASVIDVIPQFHSVKTPITC